MASDGRGGQAGEQPVRQALRSIQEWRVGGRLPSQPSTMLTRGAVKRRCARSGEPRGPGVERRDYDLSFLLQGGTTPFDRA